MKVLETVKEYLPFGGFRAASGAVEPGAAYVVGERGKELFVPEMPGRIVPHEKVSTFTRVMETVREYLPFGGFRAAGGRVEPGLAYVVGERGKELFVPKIPGRIVPHERVSSFTKIVESVKQYLPFGTGGRRNPSPWPSPTRGEGIPLTPTLYWGEHEGFPLSNSFMKVLETVKEYLPFGGFRAASGAVEPGAAYVVGERGKELFIPQQPGRIVPNEKVSSFTKVLETVREYLPFGGFRAAGGHVEPGLAYVVGEMGREAYVPDVNLNVPGMRALAAAGVAGGGRDGGVEISGDINVYVNGGQGQGTWRRAGVQIAEEAMLSLREARSVM